MVNYLRKLFVYDAWANREFLTALKSLPEEPLPMKRLVHILSAEKLWYERLNSQPQSLPVWPEFGWQQCEALLAELDDLWRNYFERITDADLDGTVSYRNSKGEKWDSRVQDILTHVIVHSGHHRGQIAADLRAAGIAPPYTDFIHAVRQSMVK